MWFMFLDNNDESHIDPHPTLSVSDSVRRAHGGRQESPTRSAFNRWVSERAQNTSNTALNFRLLGSLNSHQPTSPCFLLLNMKEEKLPSKKSQPNWVDLTQSRDFIFLLFSLECVQFKSSSYLLDAFKPNYVTSSRMYLQCLFNKEKREYQVQVDLPKTYISTHKHKSNCCDLGSSSFLFLCSLRKKKELPD